VCQAIGGNGIPYYVQWIASAQVESINSDFIHDFVAEGIIAVITGFQGVTNTKQLTALGKGGSDTSQQQLEQIEQILTQTK